MGIGSSELFGDLPGLIAAAIVDDDDLEVGRQLADRFLRLDDQAGDRARVVVRGKKHRETGGARLGAIRHDWLQTVARARFH